MPQNSADSTKILLLPGLLCDHTIWAAQIAVLGADRCVSITDFYDEADTIEQMAEHALAQVLGRDAEVVVTPGNGCDTFGSLYEIWTLQLDVGAAHVIASTAVFDPITVMNPADRTAAIRTETVYPGFGVQHGCNRESYHGPVYWYNASGPTRFFTDAHGNRVPEGTPMALEQYVSRHSAIGIPMNQDQSLMKLHRPTCAPGLAAAN